MKFTKLILTLTTAALLPSLASAGEMEDAVLASFERDMHYEPSTQALPAVLAEADPLIEAFRIALECSRTPAPQVTAAAIPQSGLSAGRNGG